MIIVTGGAGFIGSNIVKGLNDQGRDDILVLLPIGIGKIVHNPPIIRGFKIVNGKALLALEGFCILGSQQG